MGKGILPGNSSKSIAAVDLGSNSFHMVIARFDGHDLHVLDRLREPVRLADRLDQTGRVAESAQQRALECLERFGQRLIGIPSAQVGAVGTNTFRLAQNLAGFRGKAEKALGHPIEVISGHEEARLIYLGVAHTHSYDAHNRLVVDIGGGSTELIIGEGFNIVRSQSRPMGCVSFSNRYFPGGVFTPNGFREAELAAALELRALRKEFRQIGWDASVGASGTINGIAEIISLNGGDSGGIRLSSLKTLRRMIVDKGRVEDLDIIGLKADRRPVIAGGLAVLISVFKSLKLDEMTVSPGALREGLLYDLVGRMEKRDVRDRTIARLSDQYSVDEDQAKRVETGALRLLDQVRGSWDLNEVWHDQLLRWSARLHEIGLAVSHAGHHKHGEYLVQNSHMPGFSSDDQRMIAALVRAHRRKIPRTIFEAEGVNRRRTGLRLMVLLRLAALFYRSRVEGRFPAIRIKAAGERITLEFGPGWLGEHPLTRADLVRESQFLDGIGFDLEVESGEPAA